MLPPCSEQALRELLMRKEEEWRALQAHHTQLLEAALQDTQSRLEEAQGKLQRLQEDFIYNLQVLEERDLELERYDVAFAQARGQEEARRAEVSELKIEVAKLKQELTREARRVEELQQQQQRRSQEHRLELERVHSDKNNELDHQREQYETLKWRLERKLEELDGELALQRQELLLEFESEMQKREHEFRLRADSMSGVVLSHELKVKLLNKELEALKEAGVQAAESLQKAESANAELEMRLQGRAWELQDLEAVKDARIKELEDKFHSVQLTRKKEEEIFKRKHEELDRLAREREAVLVAVKGAHAEQLRALEARVLELQGHCETLEVQLRRAEWTQADAAKAKDAIADRLRDDAAALKAAWDAQVAQLSKEALAKDLEVQTLREDEVKLKAQLARFQQDVERYKQQLSLAVERERSLERDQVQLGLDWQRRCDNIERDQIQRSEALIQGLTEAKGQVAAKLQETERVLREQEVVLKAVTLERDQAVETLRTHRLLPGQEILLRQHKEEMSDEFLSSEIQRLQEQNASLRSTVAQMRREMETLSQQILPSAQLGQEASGASQPNPRAGGDAPPHYVLALEAEMQNLKHKFKALEEQLDGVPEPPKTSSGDGDLHPSTPTSAESAGGHVQAAQASTGLALRKLGDRVHLLNLLVTQLKKKVQQKPLELDTVQRELPREVDQVHLEVLELWKQVAELERHVRTTQQEGGEPSGRKQLGSKGPVDGRPVGTEDQEECPGYPQPGVSVSHLQRKLKEAARKILSLRLEKEQLIEMGNRLRAELGHPKGRRPSRPLLPAPDPQGQSKVQPQPLDGSLPLRPMQNRSPTQDPQRPKKECLSECSGKNQHQATQTVSRNHALLGRKAGAATGLAQRLHRIPRATCRSPPQKENRSPKPPRTQEVPEENDGHHTQGSSSLASSSLQDTWKLLDLGSSPSGPPSQEDSAPELLAPPAARSLQDADRSAVKTQVDFAIKGMKMAGQLKATPTRPSRSLPAKSISCPKPPRVRNYNVKD